jgi:energy-coupling factor transporter ATP-binding protein EcfA2
MSDNTASPDQPTLDWSDSQLLHYLANEWGMAGPLRVMGRLRRSESGGFGFLDELHDPTTGVKLPSLSHVSRLHQGVFVAPPDMESLTAQGVADFAVAELMLAPRHRRQEKKDPLSCMARPNSMMALSRVPESWGLTSIAKEKAPLLLSMAREAIEAQLHEDTAELKQQLDRAREEQAILMEQHEALRADSDTKQQALSIAIQQTELQLQAAIEKVGALDSDFNLRRQILDNKLRDLEALLRERGERLVALDLVERNDLKALMPQLESTDTRAGHDFQQLLEGDFAGLAPFIQARLWKKNFLFSQAQLRDFLALVRTHDLVVLAGDSGSGKTSLVRAVAESIGGRCTVIPVKPNWTGPEDLLGYYNPIERSYHATPFLKALQAAAAEPEVPHFICLDEMNIARVEHYFADFLSLLEARDSAPTIPLYTSDEERHAVVENSLFLTLEEEARRRAGMADGSTFAEILKNQPANDLLHQLGGFKDAESVLLHHARLRRSLGALLSTPCSIKFPSNVRIIGAINIDETTHYLSPKVLDRAHVMRFRNPVLTNWEAIEAEVQQFDVDVQLPMRLSATDLGLRGDYPAYDRTSVHAALLSKLARNQLDPLGVEFGLRAIRQSLGYLEAAQQAGIDELTAFDNVVQHKILPKLMFDAGRTDANGRSKRELLIDLRDEINAALPGLQRVAGEETSVMSLDRLIASIAGRNGIANYWLR